MVFTKGRTVLVRRGHEKGDNTVGKLWSKPMQVNIRQGEMLYSYRTATIVINGKEEKNIVQWRDNVCIRSKKTLNRFALKIGMGAKPNRIDLLDRLGNTVVSLSSTDQDTYDDLIDILTNLIGPASCEIQDTKAEKYRIMHRTVGGHRRKRKFRRRTRKHKRRKTKRKHHKRIRRTKRRRR